MDSAFTRSNDPGLVSPELHFNPYIPEEFANFEVYNASLETQEGAMCVQVLTETRATEKEVSRSPTVSTCTSGYFSHSASNATLSDVLFSGSDSCDQLNIREPPDPQEAPHGRGLHPSRSASGSFPAQTVPAQPCSHHCTDRDSSPRLPHECILSISQDFTDFKGVDDGGGEEDLSNIGWKAESVPPDFKGVSHGIREDLGNIGSKEESVPPDFKGVGHGIREDLGSIGWKADSIPQAKTQGMDPPSQCHLHNGKESPSIPLPHAKPQLEATLESFEDADFLADSSEDENAPVAQLPDWMAPGEQVWVGKRSGTVHYVGGVEFAKGIWVGVELDLAVGK